MPLRSPWNPLHVKLHRTIRSRQLLERNQRILVAVSGGQDSLCLFKLLLDLQSKWGWQLGIAHCDHRWRSDSQANANYVQQLALTWSTPFYCHTADQPLPSEAAARQWRYQALNAIASKNNYTCIVTGHTLSDRAETLLYNLIRGSGADGLQALTWKRPLDIEVFGGEKFFPKTDAAIFLVRPLLEISRSETGQFCQNMHIKVWEDSTNQDLKYARNRIRQELIPVLRHFNPQVESTLAQTAELLQAEVEYLEQAAHQLFVQVISDELLAIHQLPIRLNRRVLQTAPLALQRRVMRQILQQILPINPSFEHIEKLTELITAPNRSQTDPFPGGAIASVNKDWIELKQS